MARRSRLPTIYLHQYPLHYCRWRFRPTMCRYNWVLYHHLPMHERLARLSLSMWPLAIKPCPIDVPPMQQAFQWHKYRTQDQGIVWLRGLFRQAAAVLPLAHR